jgi:hypothetical protein
MLASDRGREVSGEALEAPVLYGRALAVTGMIDEHEPPALEGRKERRPAERVAGRAVEQDDGGVASRTDERVDLEAIGSVTL